MIHISKKIKIIIAVVIAVVLVCLCIIISPFAYLVYYEHFGLDNNSVLEKSIENVNKHYDYKYNFEYIDHEDNTMGFFGVSTTPSIELNVEGFNRSIDAYFDRRILCPFIGFELRYTDLDKIRVYEEIEDNANEFIKSYIDEGVCLVYCEYSSKLEGEYRELDISMEQDKYSFDVNLGFSNSDDVDTLNFCMDYDLYNKLSEEEILNYVILLKQEFDLDFIILSVLKENKSVNENISELLDNSISYHIGYLGSLEYSVYDKIMVYDIENNVVVLDESDK